MSSGAIGSAYDVSAVDSRHILDVNVGVRGALSAVILDIDRIGAVFRIHPTHSDVVRPVAHFHGTSVISLPQADIFNGDIPHAQALVSAGNGDRVPSDPEGLDVSDESADDVSATAFGRYFDAVLGAIVELASFETEVAPEYPDERGAVLLVYGIVVAVQLDIGQYDAYGINDDERGPAQLSRKPGVETFQSH